MKWFKHETSDRNKVESKLIKAKFGAEGYGIYQALLEVIGENIEGHNIKDWGHVNGMHDINTLADECAITTEKLKDFLHFCDEKGIFKKHDGKLFSPLILRRLDEFATKVKKGVGVTPDSVPTQSRLTPARREEKRIDKKRREETPAKPELLINSKKYLLEIPEEDKQEFLERFDIYEPRLISEAEKAHDWLEANGRVKKNHKAFLRNWIKGAEKNGLPIYKERTPAERKLWKENQGRIVATKEKIAERVEPEVSEDKAKENLEKLSGMKKKSFGPLSRGMRGMASMGLLPSVTA